MEFVDGSVWFFVGVDDVGWVEEDFVVDYVGELLMIVFNLIYLMDGLSLLCLEWVFFGFMIVGKFVLLCLVFGDDCFVVGLNGNGLFLVVLMDYVYLLMLVWLLGWVFGVWVGVCLLFGVVWFLVLGMCRFGIVFRVDGFCWV